MHFHGLFIIQISLLLFWLMSTGLAHAKHADTHGLHHIYPGPESFKICQMFALLNPGDSHLHFSDKLNSNTFQDHGKHQNYILKGV